MCGLVGLLSENVRPDDLSSPMEQLLARGPDESTALVTSWYALGFTRLSIISKSTGRQPVASEDQAIVIAFNGEIYNFDSLKDEFFPEVASEAQLLMFLYRAYGPSFVDLLDGDYAIVVLNARDRTCELYRDPLGVKPLYYARRNNGDWLFASSIGSLFSFSGFSSDLDVTSLEERFVLGFWSLNSTCFVRIKQCPPGGCVTLSSGSDPRVDQLVSIESYDVPPRLQTYADVVQMISDNLRKAIIKRIRHSDYTPIVISLSGGIDSTLMSALAVQDNSEKIAAITLCDREDSQDLSYASQVAQKLQIEHHVHRVALADFKADFAAMVLAQAGASASYSAFQVGRGVSQRWPGARVLLSGEGADEMFLGYSLHCNFRAYLGRLRSKLVAIPAERLTCSPLLTRVERWSGLLSRSGWLDMVELFRRDQLVNSHLLTCDHGHMAHSIECRVPFLAREVISIVEALPQQASAVFSKPKTLLRLALAHALGEERSSLCRTVLSRQSSPAFTATARCRQWLDEFVSRQLHRRRFRMHGIERLASAPSERFWLAALSVVFQQRRCNIAGMTFEDLSEAIFED